MKKIKLLKQYQCACNEEGGIIRKALRSESLFHESGEILKEVSYEHEEPAGYIEQQVDHQGHITHIAHYDKDGACLHEEELTYSDSGNPQSRKLLYENNGFELIQFYYGADGRVLEEITTDETNTLLSKTVYEYDDLGRLVREMCFNETADGELEWGVEYKYVGNTKTILEEKRLGPEGEVFEIGLYQYDEAGNRILEDVVNEFGKPVRQIESVFNGKGQKEEVSELDFDRKRLVKHFYTYDEDGRLDQEKVYLGDQLIQEITTEYDPYGNPQKELKLQAMLELGDYYAYTATLYEMEYFDAEA